MTKPNEPESEFLTLAEAARLLRVSTWTLRRYVQAGRIPAARLGRSYRFRRRDIEAALFPSTSPPCTSSASAPRRPTRGK